MLSTECRREQKRAVHRGGASDPAERLAMTLPAAGVVGVHASGLREARPLTLDARRAPVQALWPLSESELLFGDDAGGLWRWRHEDGTRPESVTQIAGGIDALVRTQDGAVTLLSRGRRVGAGMVKL